MTIRFRNSQYIVDEDEGTVTNKESGKVLKEGSSRWTAVMNRVTGETQVKGVLNPDQAIREYPPLKMQTHEQLQEYQDLLEQRLNYNQQKFAIEYVRGDHMGNQTRSYAVAYGKDLPDEYDACRVGATLQMKRTEVLEYIDFLLFMAGYSSSSVDTHLLFLINQHSDLRAKLGAIKEWNKLQGRITDRLEVRGHVQHSTTQPDYSQLEDHELETLIKLLEKTKHNNAKEIGGSTIYDTQDLDD